MTIELNVVRRGEKIAGQPTSPARGSMSRSRVEMPDGYDCLALVPTAAARYGTRAVLGLGLFEYLMPAFSTAPGTSKNGKCAIVRNGATSFCFLPPLEKNVVKKQHLFG